MIFRIHVHVDTSPRISHSLSLSQFRMKLIQISYCFASLWFLCHWYGQNLLSFPQSGHSLEALESLNSLESLENGLFWKDPIFSRRTPFFFRTRENHGNHKMTNWKQPSFEQCQMVVFHCGWFGVLGPGGSWTLWAWLPLQSLAVKRNSFFFCANFGRWKTFKICWKVPAKYF